MSEDNGSRSEPEGCSQKIQRRLAQASRAFNVSHVGLCYLDTQLRFIHINDSLAAINGFPPKEHIGKFISEVLPEIAAAGAEKELRSVLETGESVTSGTVTAPTPAHPGSAHTYAHDYHALRSKDGDIIGVVCCVMDRTDLKRAEQERNKYIRDIEEFNKTAIGRKFRRMDLKRELNE